jgi:hypothetical protein
VPKPKKEWWYGPKNDPRRFKTKLFKCTNGHTFAEWIREGKRESTVSLLKGVGRPKRKAVTRVKRKS